jgi:Tfp pilus assembly protein PilP
MAKEIIKDYEHFKRLRESKAIRKKETSKEIMKRYKVERMQLLGWMARYQTARAIVKEGMKK